MIATIDLISKTVCPIIFGIFLTQCKYKCSYILVHVTIRNANKCPYVIGFCYHVCDWFLVLMAIQFLSLFVILFRKVHAWLVNRVCVWSSQPNISDPLLPFYYVTASMQALFYPFPKPTSFWVNPVIIPHYCSSFLWSDNEVSAMAIMR